MRGFRSPVRVTKKETSELCSDVSFYPSRRLGMESRASVHGIARRMASRTCVYFLRLDSMRDCVAIPYRNALRIPCTPAA
jgi:hypothetical protein